MYQQHIGQHYSGQGTAGDPMELYHNDVIKFITTYMQDCLLDCQPGRHHAAFKDFDYDEHIDKPDKFHSKLNAHCAKLDRGRTIHPDC